MFTLNFPCNGSVIFVRIVHIAPTFFHCMMMARWHGRKTTLHSCTTLLFPVEKNKFMVRNKQNYWELVCGAYVSCIMFVENFSFLCCNPHWIWRQSVYNACFVWNYKKHNSVISDTYCPLKLRVNSVAVVHLYVMSCNINCVSLWQ